MANEGGKQQRKASSAEEETATAAALAERGDAERDLVEEQTEAAETAEQKRERQSARAQELRSVPEGAAAPTEKTARGGDTQFSRSRFLDPAEGPALTGYAHHVIAGALHLDDAEYQSVESVQGKVEAWLQTEVGVPADGTDQG